MENIRFTEINDPKQKSDFTLNILNKLPQWFSDKKAVKEYAKKVRELPFWAAFDRTQYMAQDFWQRKHITGIQQKFMYAE